MTEKGYDIVEIVDAVRRAGNPRQAALEAVADTERLEDAELLDALGVETWGELPTTPYPDGGGQAAPAAKPARKKPGPKPGSRRKAAAGTGPAKEAAPPPALLPAPPAEPVPDAGQAEPDDILALRERLGEGMDGLDTFLDVWCGHLYPNRYADAKRAAAQAHAYLDGMDIVLSNLRGR